MSNESKNGIGFFGLLQIAFIVLKLCQVIDWDWVLVLSPVLAYISIVVMAILIGSTVGIVKAILKKRKQAMHRLLNNQKMNCNK